MSAIRCAVWGSGAIGGVVAAGMTEAGEDVLLVDVVPGHVKAMNDAGLVIRMAGEERRSRVRAVLPDQVEGVFDLVFLAVKTQFTQSALDAIEPHLHEGSAVVSLQNGVNEPHITQRIGAARTIGCLVDFSADYDQPGVIARGQAEGNTKIRTGYWRDIVVRKRKTEIEHITGEIVRCGERRGVPTPLNRLQWSMFDDIENGTRPMQWANLDALDAALAKLHSYQEES